MQFLIRYRAFRGDDLQAAWYDAATLREAEAKHVASSGWPYSWGKASIRCEAEVPRIKRIKGVQHLSHHERCQRTSDQPYCHLHRPRV